MEKDGDKEERAGEGERRGRRRAEEEEEEGEKGEQKSQQPLIAMPLGVSAQIALGSLWKPLGAYGGRGGVGCLEDPLEASWVSLGCLLEASWTTLGAISALPGALLEAFLGALRALLGP